MIIGPRPRSSDWGARVRVIMAPELMGLALRALLMTSVPITWPKAFFLKSHGSLRVDIRREMAYTPDAREKRIEIPLTTGCTTIGMPANSRIAAVNMKLLQSLMFCAIGLCC